MVKRNKQTTNTATEMREMRVLIERLFAELNARQDKFDQAILQLKECIESSKGGKAVESVTDDHGNSCMLQGPGKALIATEPNEKQAKGLCLFCDEKSTGGHKCSSKKHDVSLMEDEDDDDDDDDVDVPIVDLVTTEETKIDMAISVDAVVEYSTPYDGGSCVTGYHGKQPLAVLMDAEETSHNFIKESLADKLGCETSPIEPRTVRSALGKMVTSRVCNNFQLSMQGTVFNLKLYLLPLSSNCDMVLGGEWLGTLEKLIISSDGVEFYFEGKKKFMPINQLEDASAEGLC